MDITSKIVGNRLVFTAENDSGTAIDSREEKQGIKKANFLEHIFGKWFTTKILVNGKEYEVNKKSLGQYLVRTSQKASYQSRPTSQVHNAAMKAFEAISSKEAKTTPYLRGQALLTHLKAHIERNNDNQAMSLIEYTSDTLTGSLDSEVRWENFYKTEAKHIEDRLRAEKVLNIKDSQELTPSAQFEQAFLLFISLDEKIPNSPTHLESFENQQAIFNHVKNLEENLKMAMKEAMKSIHTILTEAKGYIRDLKNAHQLEDQKENLETELSSYPERKEAYERNFITFNAIEHLIGSNREIFAEIKKTSENDLKNLIQELKELPKELIEKIEDSALKEHLNNYNHLLKQFKESFTQAIALKDSLPSDILYEEAKIKNLQEKIESLNALYKSETKNSLTADDYSPNDLNAYSIDFIRKFQQIFEEEIKNIELNIKDSDQGCELERLQSELNELYARKKLLLGKKSKLEKLKQSKYTPKILKNRIKIEETKTLPQEIAELEKKISELKNEQRKLIDFGGSDHPDWARNLNSLAEMQQLQSEYVTAQESGKDRLLEISQLDEKIHLKESEIKEAQTQKKQSVKEAEKKVRDLNALLKQLEKALKFKLNQFQVLAKEYGAQYDIKIEKEIKPHDFIQKLKSLQNEASEKIRELQKDFERKLEDKNRYELFFSNIQIEIVDKLKEKKPIALEKSDLDLNRELKEVNKNFEALKNNMHNAKLTLLNETLAALNIKEKSLENLYYDAQVAQIIYYYYFSSLLPNHFLCEEKAHARRALECLKHDFSKMGLCFQNDFSIIHSEIRKVILENGTIDFIQPTKNEQQEKKLTPTHQSIIFAEGAIGENNPVFIRLKTAVVNQKQEELLNTLFEGHRDIFTQDLEPYIQIFMQEEGPQSNGFFLNLLRRHPVISSEQIRIIAEKFQATEKDENREREFIVVLALKHPELFNFKNSLIMDTLCDPSYLDYSKIITFLLDEHQLLLKDNRSKEEQAIRNLYHILKIGGKSPFKTIFDSMFPEYLGLIQDIK